ncbi:kinase-like protein [Lentithecium fluviatile CBS 122367]|uniref:Kinase-like protein n=1 Tax=Lentithecium fluviatile CBS 122367 TaxID=1168545 RepID=A0A6G1IQ83_9PLEO|nr:kinase-like protein [Lentithecium fluviatile CBS 122367]
MEAFNGVAELVRTSSPAGSRGGSKRPPAFLANILAKRPPLVELSSPGPTHIATANVTHSAAPKVAGNAALEKQETVQHDDDYEFIKMLGHGGSASVEMVQGNYTGSLYARKIYRNIYTRNVKAAEKRLLEEVQIMRRLAPHHHIIRVHATYVVKRELAIILEPVANGGDLATFLTNYRDRELWRGNDRAIEDDILHQAFGCLASGLAFMHRQSIRHKDIKPQNVLIHNQTVLYTDFGLSYDFVDAGQSTTTGLVQGLTMRYCAPEVADHGRRNTKSDIFSLGCVFIEIHSVLYPDELMEELLDGPFFRQLRILPNQGLPVDCGHPEMDAIRAMVRLDSTSRPTAAEVVDHFADIIEALYFCGQCWGWVGVENKSEKLISQVAGSTT